MGLRVLERLYQRKVPRELLGRRRLQEQLLRCGRLLRGGECRLGKGILGYRRRGEGRRLVEVLEEGAAEVGDGARGVDGYICEAGEILAAVGEGGEVADCRVGEEDEGDGLALDVPGLR